jgi:hypothetical protein
MYTYADFGHGNFCNRLSWGTQWMNREDEHNGIKLNTNSISHFLFVLHQNPYLWILLYKTCLLIRGLPKIIELHFTLNILTSDLMIEKEHIYVAFVELRKYSSLCWISNHVRLMIINVCMTQHLLHLTLEICPSIGHSTCHHTQKPKIWLESLDKVVTPLHWESSSSSMP